MEMKAIDCQDGVMAELRAIQSRFWAWFRSLLNLTIWFYPKDTSKPLPSKEKTDFIPALGYRRPGRLPCPLVLRVKDRIAWQRIYPREPNA